MAICKACNNEFEVPQNTIIMAKAYYCEKCFNSRLKKAITIPAKDWMNLETT